MAPGPRAGTTAVNLRIAESKPWYVYAQYSNTGTSTTTLNRERFGFTHNQLLGRDDILALDYTTGDFDEVHAVSGSYSAPFVLGAPEWRFALGGGYSRFDAREAGFTGTDVEGEDANAGGEVSRQLFQHHELFVDAAVGARWQHLEVENRQVLGARARRRHRLRGAARRPAPRARHRHLGAARARGRAGRLHRHERVRPRVGARGGLDAVTGRPSSTCSATRSPTTTSRSRASTRAMRSSSSR